MSSLRAEPSAPAAPAVPAAPFDPFAMLERFDAAVERIEQQREPRVAAAAALAEAIVNGSDFAVAGCPALRLDMAHRPGAMLGYGGNPAKPGDAVLYRLQAHAASEAEVSQSVTRIAELARGGSAVVVLAERDRLASLGHLHALERHAAAVLDVGSGLPSHGKLHDVVALTAAWALHVELFAACVARGEVPVIRMHDELDRRSDRLLRYMGQRFHDDRWLEPVETGEQSHAFLQRVTELSLDLRTASGNALERAVWRCRDAARFGGRVYVAGGPRAVFLRGHLRQAGGPLTAWPGADRLAQPLGSEEVVLGFCNIEPPDVAHWPDVEAMRRAGRGVVWIMPAFGITPRDLPDGDVLMDNQVPFADAAISVDRYDARLGPLSSIANELILISLSTAAEPAEK